MRIHRHRYQQTKLNVPEYRVNEKIIAPQVRVIGSAGESFGIMEIAKAVVFAQEKEMDLVEVFPKADPPVCKLLNFGQFKYQKEKEVRKQKAQSKEVETKGIRLTFRIGDHDFEVRLDQAKKFLERGDKVRLELPLRGREKAHKDVAEKIMSRFLEGIKLTYPLRIEQPITYLGGRFTAIVARA